jgi:hypothetical protein
MKTIHAVAAMIAVACTPLAGFAGTSASIDSSGTNPSFCDITSAGSISMDVTAQKDKLTGTGSYEFVSNGRATVTLSALAPSAPAEAAAYIPSVSLANLVSSNSTTASVTGAEKTGVNRFSGNITTEITQNNASQLLSAGSYTLATTATCTAL